MTACSGASILKEATTVHVTSISKQIPPTGEGVLVSVIRNAPSKKISSLKGIYVIRSPEGPMQPRASLKIEGIVFPNMEQPKTGKLIYIFIFFARKEGLSLATNPSEVCRQDQKIPPAAGTNQIA